MADLGHGRFGGDGLQCGSEGLGVSMASVAREAGVGKATGHLRADFASEDLVVLLMANAGVIAATADDAPDTWRRLVGTNAPCLRHPRRSTPAHAGRTSLHRAMARFGKSHTDEP